MRAVRILLACTAYVLGYFGAWSILNSARHFHHNDVRVPEWLAGLLLGVACPLLLGAIASVIQRPASRIHAVTLAVVLAFVAPALKFWIDDYGLQWARDAGSLGLLATWLWMAAMSAAGALLGKRLTAGSDR